MRKNLVFVLLSFLLLTGCGEETPPPASVAPTPQILEETPAASLAEEVDYAGEVKLDLNSSTAKCEVTVKSFVDGDTVHFHVPEDVMEEGVLKG